MNDLTKEEKMLRHVMIGLLICASCQARLLQDPGWSGDRQTNQVEPKKLENMA